jgi:phosphinothricin acetyltransferase
VISDAAEADAGRCAVIYAPYVRDTLAGIALPNEASTGLHRALGFEPVGTYRRVGWKHGRWHDVAWYQRALGDDDGPPEPLR